MKIMQPVALLKKNSSALLKKKSSQLKNNILLWATDSDDAQSLGSNTTEDTGTPAFGMSGARKEAMNLLAVRKAAAVAVGSTASMITMLNGCEKDQMAKHVRLSIQLKELECFILTSEHAFMEKVLVELDYDEKLRTVFDLIDFDGNGIDSRELAEAFRRLEGLNTTLDQFLPMAQEAIERFATRDGVLTIGPFEKFLEWLADIMDCNFNEVLSVLISKIAFSQDGRAVLEEFVSLLVDENGADDFVGTVLRARMLMLFETMDIFQDGMVCFSEVVKHLSRFTKEVLNPEQRCVLLTIDPNEKRHLTMGQFTELVLNITAASPTPLESHEIANAMTLSICRQDVTDEDVKELFLNMGAFESAIADAEKDDLELEDLVSYGKLNRLFDTLDITKDGHLDFEEVALFLRKYQSRSVYLTDTVQEALDSIEASDLDGDRQLDRKEFAFLITKLAHATGIEIHRFTDFLVVQSVLKDDVDKDIRYLEVYRKLHSEKQDSKQQGAKLKSSVMNLMIKARQASLRRRNTM